MPLPNALTDCPFKAIDVLNEAEKWILKKIIDSDHNHEGDDENSHARIRSYFLNPVVRADIKQQHSDGASSKQILSFVRNKYGGGAPNNPIIGPKDVYNAMSRVRDEELENMTAILALNVALHADPTQWFVRVNTDPVTHEVLHLFWINKASMKMLRTNDEILLLDCTYKTNRYRMPLCVLGGVTCLNTSFYSGMCLMKGKKLEDYQ